MTTKEKEDRDTTAKLILQALAHRVKARKMLTRMDLNLLTLVCKSYAMEMDMVEFARKVASTKDNWEGFAEMCEDWAQNGLPLDRELTDLIEELRSLDQTREHE